MNAQIVWIVANVMNVCALSTLVGIFWRRRRRALDQPADDAVAVPYSVRESRRLNAVASTADATFYALLAALGIGMIGAALLWPFFDGGEVPWLIPGGTTIITIIYLGKAIVRAWEGAQRERLVNIGRSEAWRRWQIEHNATGDETSIHRHIPQPEHPEGSQRRAMPTDMRRGGFTDGD